MTTNKKAGRPVGTSGKAAVISDKELNRVLESIKGKGHHVERNTLVIILSNLLGLRAKELASLKISDTFDESPKKVLRLISPYTKGSKHRDVSLEHLKVQKAISAYITYRIQEDGLTFNTEAPLFRSQKGTAFSPNSMTRLLTDIYHHAGFKECSSHTGRRSLITKLAYKGVDINSIRQIAGHSSIATTQQYIQDNPQLMADILKSV